jgi:hypothetical protein
VEDATNIAKRRPPGDQWLGDRDYWWEHLASRYLPAIASDGKRCLVTYEREFPFAGSGRPKPGALVVNPADGRLEVGPVKLPGAEYDTPAACATSNGWAVVLMDWAHGWTPAPRLGAVRLDGELKSSDAFAKQDTNEPDRLPLENLGRSLMPAGADGLSPGKGSVAFWRPAAAWDGRRVVTATDFGWRDHRDANAIHYVIAVNRLAMDTGQFVQPASAIVAATERADQAVANPALTAGPLGEVLLVYEHDEAVYRQVIEARILKEK